MKKRYFVLVFLFLLFINIPVVCSAEEYINEEDVDVQEDENVITGFNAGFYSYNDAGVSSDGEFWYYNGKLIKNSFFFDGKYTYFLQNDGTSMTDRLTYHPDGVHIIYFDKKGREVFGDFQYCDSVGYTCYFDSNGFLYKDVITYDKDGNPYYLNSDGRLENRGWFQFANGQDFGYAEYDGILRHNGFDYDPYGRVVFYHWNGMVARGLIKDWNYYYSMDYTDGHYLGRFRTENEEVYGPGSYLAGVNLPSGECMLVKKSDKMICRCIVGNKLYGNNSGKYSYIAESANNIIITLPEGANVEIVDAYVAYDVDTRAVNMEPIYSQSYNANYYSFDVKVGKHIVPGTYRIGLPVYYGSSYDYTDMGRINVCNNSLYDNSKTNLAYTYQGTNGGYVDITVSEGQILSLSGITSFNYLGY